MSSCCYHTRNITTIFTLFSLLDTVLQAQQCTLCNKQPLSISGLLSFHAILLAGIFYFQPPVMSQVLMISEASLHEKKQAVNGSFVHSLLRQMLLVPENANSKGKMRSLLHTLQISYGLLTKELLADHVSITNLAQFSVTFPTNQNTFKNWNQPSNFTANSCR